MGVLLFLATHGLGLATKLQNLTLTDDGLITNMLSFNVGVELGQVTALAAVLLLLMKWRSGNTFQDQAFVANTLLMTCGFLLAGYQFTGFFIDANT